MRDSNVYFMRFVGIFQVVLGKYLYFSWYKVGGGTVMRKKGAADFSISVFGRFSYTASEPDEHYQEI